VVRMLYQLSEWVIAPLSTCLVETGVPTSVDFVQCEPTQMVVAYTSANAYIFDIEKSKPVVTLDYKPSLGITNHKRWLCLHADVVILCMKLISAVFLLLIIMT